MNEPCHDKLECDWELFLHHKDFKKLGKILRAEINLLKRTDSGIKQFEAELSEKVKFLEQSLPEMDFRTSIQVIGDISHARRTLKYSHSEFGAAFTRKLPAKDRKRIRRRNPTPRLGASNGKYDQKGDAGGSDPDDLQFGDLGDEET